MTPYIRNSNCQCARCRAHGLMLSAVLVTLGIIILLKNYGIVPIHESVPVILLVIGGMLLISRTGSTEGHIQPGWIQYPTAPAAPAAQQPWTTGATPPPPPASQQWTSGADNPPSSSGQNVSADQNDSQVKP